jgi:hypothetical protein
MDTLNDITELNVELAESQDTPADEMLDVELIPHEWTREKFNAYRSKLRLMDKIHNELASKINANRQATLNVFFRPEDNFIPETTSNDHFGLWLATQANTMPSLP